MVVVLQRTHSYTPFVYCIVVVYCTYVQLPTVKKILPWTTDSFNFLNSSGFSTATLTLDIFSSGLCVGLCVTKHIHLDEHLKNNTLYLSQWFDGDSLQTLLEYYNLLMNFWWVLNMMEIWEHRIWWNFWNELTFKSIHFTIFFFEFSIFHFQISNFKKEFLQNISYLKKIHRNKV